MVRKLLSQFGRQTLGRAGWTSNKQAGTLRARIQLRESNVPDGPKHAPGPGPGPGPGSGWGVVDGAWRMPFGAKDWSILRPKVGPNGWKSHPTGWGTFSVVPSRGIGRKGNGCGGPIGRSGRAQAPTEAEGRLFGCLQMATFGP